MPSSLCSTPRRSALSVCHPTRLPPSLAGSLPADAPGTSRTDVGSCGHIPDTMPDRRSLVLRPYPPPLLHSTMCESPRKDCSFAGARLAGQVLPLFLPSAYPILLPWVKRADHSDTTVDDHRGSLGSDQSQYW